MRTIYITCLCLLTSMHFWSQEIDFKEEMIKSGEHYHRDRSEMPDQKSDYKSYIRAKAWHTAAKKKNNAELFLDTKDLDIVNIGGRVRSSLVDTDNGIALVAPSGGGLWKFDPDNGAPFEPVDDFAPFLAITAIAQNPFSPMEIMIGTGDEFHSTLGTGVFFSNDGGNTFSLVESTDPEQNSDFNRIRFVKYSPEQEDVIYLTANDKLYKSINAGQTWELTFDAPNRIRTIDFTSNSGVIVGVNGEGIYTSSNGDANTFAKVTNGLPGVISYAIVATHAANRSICYSLVTNSNTGVNAVYKSTNNGQTWSLTANDFPFTIAQTFFSITIGVHPMNPDILFMGSIGWGTSQDGGVTWTRGTGLEVDYHDIHFHESQPNIGYVGYDQGLGRLDFADFGTNAVPAAKQLGKEPGFNTNQINYGDYYPENYGDAFLFGQQDGGCFVRVNGIQRRVRVGDGSSIFISKQNPNYAFSSIQFGRLYRTTVATNLVNFNSDWEELTIPREHDHFVTHFVGNDADGEQIYIPQETDLYRTLNHGDSFELVASTDVDDAKIAVENALDPIIYMFGLDSNSRPKGYRITNAATNPVTQEVPMPDLGRFNTPREISIDPENMNTIYITFRTGEAYKFSNLDGTPVVTNLRTNLPDVSFRKIIRPGGGNDLLLAGTNIGLFYSIDDGANWILSDQVPYTSVRDLKLRVSDNRLFLFTYGRGTWATTLDLDSTVLSTDYWQSEDFNQMTVYPNPATASIAISTGNISDKAKIRIYDIDGKLMINTKEVSKVDISALSSGLYIVHLIKDKTITAIEKLVVK